MFRPLCAENPLPAARRVYEYLQSLSGKCLTGQMESQWCRSTEHEISYLTDVTGRQPAIRGLDFMDNDYLGVTQRAKDWWARGGIPTICWHTGADFFSGYPECRESELDWASAFVDGTEANRRLLDGLDHAVPYLKRLRSDSLAAFPRDGRRLVLVGTRRRGEFCAPVAADARPLHACSRSAESNLGAGLL